jgi:hypothetical protein
VKLNIPVSSLSLPRSCRAFILGREFAEDSPSLLHRKIWKAGARSRWMHELGVFVIGVVFIQRNILPSDTGKLSCRTTLEHIIIELVRRIRKSITVRGDIPAILLLS